MRPPRVCGGKGDVVEPLRCNSSAHAPRTWYYTPFPPACYNIPRMAREIVCVAAAGDIPPGSMIYVEIDGLPIALANVDGVIYAFSDSCRHEGGPLSSGVLIGETVTCPWHGWTYNVRTGKAIVPPIGIRIPTYETRIDDDSIFVIVDWPD